MLLSSLGGFAAATLLARTFDRPFSSDTGEVAFAVLIPAIELGVAVAVERRTTRERVEVPTIRDISP